MSRPTSAATGEASATADDLLSIGDLARLTGISPDTIRMWERRYGRPQPVRLPSGHRRYRRAQVRWLRRMAEALALGHRPSSVVHLDEAELDGILFGATGRPAGHEAEIRDLVRIAGTYRTQEMMARLRAAVARDGARRALHDWIGPLLDGLGRAWADGEIEIRHEHLVVQLVDDLLREMRLGCAPATSGPLVVLATLSGESHALGLEMAHLVCALDRVRSLSLGPSLPNDEIVAAARDTAAAGVAISVSLATGGVENDRTIAELRAALPARVRLVVGGRGARGVRRGPRDVDYALDLPAFEEWLSSLRDRTGATAGKAGAGATAGKAGAGAKGGKAGAGAKGGKEDRSVATGSRPPVRRRRPPARGH